MLHKVRFVSEGTRTRIFLDDQEVLGCVSASFDYEVNALPVVKLELNALNVEVEADTADVCKVSEEPIESLDLSSGTINILKKGIWYNKYGEKQIDPVMTIGKLLYEYQGGRLTKYKGIGPSRYCKIVYALKRRGLI